jgi:glycosyltransferase involved in cell wall biosynthesis
MHTLSHIIRGMKLSVVVPVYNEEKTIAEILKRVQKVGLAHEIIVVDDGSSDGTAAIIKNLRSDKSIKFIAHPKNMGKGAAVRTGIEAATGEIILVQDADLEYYPEDYPALIKPIENGSADAVYGSRFMGGPRRTTMFWHMVANKMLTFLTNILYNNILTDMETGYKLFKREILQDIKIRSNNFDFEPEITAKLLKRRARIFEVPITFNPRDYSEGKKIGLKDAFQALWALVKYRFVD